MLKLILILFSCQTYVLFCPHNGPFVRIPWDLSSQLIFCIFLSKPLVSLGISLQTRASQLVQSRGQFRFKFLVIVSVRICDYVL